MYILHVIPFQRSTHQEELSYFSMAEVPLGSCVEMPYGTRTLMGAVTSCAPLSDMKSQVKNMSFQLKNIHRVLQSSPVSSAAILAIQECHDRNLVPRNILFDRILPVQFLETIRIYVADKHPPVESAPMDTQHHVTLLQQSESDRVAIYTTRIRETLSAKQSVIIVCPSAATVESLEKELSKGIKDHVVALHGHLTKKKQAVIYEKIIQTERGVVCIMTPYFLGCAPTSTRLVIVHNSASGEYLTPIKPYFDFITLVEDFARAAHIECMLSDTLLPLTTTLRPVTDQVVSWYTHASYRSVASLSFQSFKHDFSKDIIHPDILSVVQEQLKERKNVAFFVPRTGYASITKCNDCQHVMACPTCDAPLRLHRSIKTLYTCSRCKTSIPPVDACQKCTGSRLVMLGISVEKVVEVLSEHILPKKIVPITGETMGKKKNVKNLATLMKEGTGICCVGTTALLSLPYQFDTVVIVSAAHLFAHTEYTSYEESLRLAMRLKEHTLDNFFIQTPEQYEALVETFWNMPVHEQLVYEEDLRKEYELPPFVRKAHIICPAESVETLTALLGSSRRMLEPFAPRILKRMPYHGYRGGICVEISFAQKSDLKKINYYLEGLKGSVYVLEK
jgi:primosomal protein N'